MDDQRIGALAPDLLATVNVRQRRHRLMAEALQENAWIHDITEVLSVPAIVQYLQLRERLDDTVLQQGVQDRVIWKWTSSGVYSARFAYAALTLGQSALYGAKEAWKVRAPREHKFFIWLVLQDHWWTNERRHRQGISDDDKCTLCDQDAESINHLLVKCVFSCQVWFKTLRRFGWQELTPVQRDAFASWWMRSRKAVAKDRRPTFDSIVFLVVRRLWLHRNERVFRNVLPSVSVTLQQIADDFSIWCRANLIDRSRLPAG
jgi:hypothetical protein